MRNIHIALLSAMPSEIGKTLDYIENRKEYKFGDLTIYQGRLRNNISEDFSIHLTIAWSGWGKVSAARACTRIISHVSKKLPIDIILFTGVAGAINTNLKQWDIIVADKVIQHDLDARPIFKKYEIPGINQEKLYSSSKWKSWVLNALNKAKQNNKLEKFGKVSSGLIATGDRFISSKDEIKKISDELGNVEAVEMEGASVAQVAFQEKIPWIIVRVISDEADESAAKNFNQFLKLYEENSWNLINSILNDIEFAPI